VPRVYQREDAMFEIGSNLKDAIMVLSLVIGMVYIFLALIKRFPY
jgi:hypothetical protein